MKDIVDKVTLSMTKHGNNWKHFEKTNDTEDTQIGVYDHTSGIRVERHRFFGYDPVIVTHYINDVLVNSEFVDQLGTGIHAIYNVLHNKKIDSLKKDIRRMSEEDGTDTFSDTNIYLVSVDNYKTPTVSTSFQTYFLQEAGKEFLKLCAMHCHGCRINDIKFYGNGVCYTSKDGAWKISIVSVKGEAQ